MNWKETKELINADYTRLEQSGRSGGKLYRLITNYSFQITYFFRVGSYLREKKGLYKFLYLLVFLIYRHIRFKTGIQLPLGCHIGGGLYFAHFGTIVVNINAHIGCNCTIFQGTTIGSMRGRGFPTIGNNCVIFSGAQVVGDIIIGNHVVVGAGAVVVKDVPDECVVSGVPARVISNKGFEISELYLL